MSLVDEDSEARWEHADKGKRTGYLLWEAGINMPRHQPAILELVGAIQALPGVDMTTESEKTGRWKDKWDRWRDMEDFWEIWQDIYNRRWLPCWLCFLFFVFFVHTSDGWAPADRDM